MIDEAEIRMSTCMQRNNIMEEDEEIMKINIVNLNIINIKVNFMVVITK